MKKVEIIIDNVKHQLVTTTDKYVCATCSLRHECNELNHDRLCEFFNSNEDNTHFEYV